MTKEEKELVLKDLCARLPYGTIIRNYATDEDDVLTYSLLEDFEIVGLEYIKPYLRPISSITEEEERELNGLLPEVYDFTFRMDELLELIQTQKEIPFHYIDWFNAHHFDYRGFIEMGLALEAPEGIYDDNE